MGRATPAIAALQDLLGRSVHERPPRLSPRELRVELAVAAGFVLAAGAMASMLDSPRPFRLGTAVLLAVAFALASSIRVYVGTVHMVPSQLVLVAMLFLLPAPAVPAVAGAGMLASALWDAARGREHPERAAMALGDAWHAVGGALVVWWAGEPEPELSALGVAVAALLAQTAVNAAFGIARGGLRDGSPPQVLAGIVALVALVDLALTPPGLAAAAAGAPLGLLAIVATLGLLAAATAERSRRIGEGVARLHALREERARLERALRRVGDAFASRLDRETLVALALETAREALGADWAVLRIGEDGSGGPDPDPGARPALRAAIEAARRRGATGAHAAGGHAAMAQPIDDGGLFCITRPGLPFTGQEQELFGHLCRQVSVALENAELHARLRREATEDELTGLANHRRFQEVLAGEVERARRSGDPLAVILVDIDDFKAVNDTYGHQCGDAVLHAVGAAVAAACRRTDVPARYGGEEIAVVLPDTDLDGAHVVAEKLRRAIAGLHLEPGGAGPAVTVSVGVAARAAGVDTPGALVAAADAALYEAKRTGKNRTVQAPVGT